MIIWERHGMSDDRNPPWIEQALFEYNFLFGTINGKQYLIEDLEEVTFDMAKAMEQPDVLIVWERLRAKITARLDTFLAGLK